MISVETLKISNDYKVQYSDLSCPQKVDVSCQLWFMYLWGSVRKFSRSVRWDLPFGFLKAAYLSFRTEFSHVFNRRYRCSNVGPQNEISNIPTVITPVVSKSPFEYFSQIVAWKTYMKLPRYITNFQSIRQWDLAYAQNSQMIANFSTFREFTLFLPLPTIQSNKF